jgi:hypothetical protein
MCTVTLIPTPGGYRLATNRDERRSRPRAARPMVRGGGGVRMVWPLDPAGGGTWVSVNDLGVTLTILNLNEAGLPPAPPAGDRRSRGLVIPPLADAPDAGAALSRLEAMDLSSHAWFRLVGIDAGGGFVARWDRVGLTSEPLDGSPVCLASSGLGDDLVRVRLPLFEGMVVASGATPASQDAFHGHRWEDRPERSVRMSRRGARTVSTTVVEVDGGAVRMSYRDDDGWAPAVALERRGAAHAAGSGARG